MKVIVIGGGPAGMMAAISSAENGRIYKKYSWKWYVFI